MIWMELWNILLFKNPQSYQAMAKLFLTLFILISIFFLVESGIRNVDSKINIDPISGKFNVVVNGNTWFKSSDVYFRNQDVEYSTSDGSLSLLRIDTSFGSDKLGQFTKSTLEYTSSNKVISYYCNIYQYEVNNCTIIRPS